MSNKEKLPKLVDVYRPSNPLCRRQLPLVVDENLTLVMDIRTSGIVCDSQILRGKELDEFASKWGVLSPEEFKSSLQITKSELLHVLNENVPCVGCRRSVERLYIQLLNFGHPTLDPVIVKSDGTITIREEKQAYPVLASIFHDHAIRLAKLIENQPKRNKKSVRCLLHSLDSQRSRPLTPVWRDVWDCMKPECKRDVCIIEASSLHTTLENYLRKHRFCGECRTKVLKAYTLLVEDPEPSKEKGYVSSLYAGIKRCLPDKHIHLKAQTDYIMKLINRAEPELLGRERHAKTLEIAQEEVLTCLGICMYERLHRMYMRVREEERTCQLFAAVAVHALSRSFETVVERVRGISQLELLYEEFAREEQAKQIRKEAKKSKRRRKRGKILDHDEKENCCEDDDDYKEDIDKGCSCSPSPIKDNILDYCGCEDPLLIDKEHNCESKLRCTNDLWIDDCKCENNIKAELNLISNGNIKREQSLCKCDSGYDASIFNNNSKKEFGSNSDHSHDCGYSSEYNNACCETGSLTSSMSSSPEGSELACSDSCCQPREPVDFSAYCRLTCGGGLSLQEMLEVHSEDDEEYFITAEEVREFKSRSRQVYEKRQELRDTLQKRFAQFCVNGPLQVPDIFVQTKYASN
ncbi:gametogenetin-binding protein 2-like isoform X2 [Cylas formicarius]|uniref:gametogenetin-binding protein 2-like isoform X2 n=1 Tax=Cylas formicarius TaxID=197179 RepID=UPI0029583940|nr:gametogenetin-binding protein 2-like isoform X2 [Cylas formicarius]